MYRKDDGKELMEAILMLFGLAVLFILMPFISYWAAYFGGWIASIVIGDTLCNALNTLFGTLRFHPEMLPQMAGALGWIGSFFKATTSTSKKK